MTLLAGTNKKSYRHKDLMTNINCSLLNLSKHEGLAFKNSTPTNSTFTALPPFSILQSKCVLGSPDSTLNKCLKKFKNYAHKRFIFI